MREHGYLEAHHMATTFNMLRANDLIWSFVVSNYLLGKKQVPVDLLFWNSDSTRMPAAMHSFYLRKMYHENLLVKPGGIKLAVRRSICRKSGLRASFWLRAKTTLRHGNRPMRRPACIPGRSNSSCRLRAIWLA
jgi:hypothetical protein